MQQIETTRFGLIEVDQTRALTFPKGLLGFADHTRYVLLEAGDESHFWWLQSLEEAGLAFVVTDPALFVPTYRVPIREQQMEDLGMSTPEQAQVFVIVNKRGHLLTGNLQGPLLVNVTDRVGEQLVLSDRRFTTRVPLLELGTQREVAASA